MAKKATKTITVEQIGSPIRRPKEQRATLVGLGLNKMHKRRTLEDIPEEPIQTPAGTRWLHTRKIPVLDEKKRGSLEVGKFADLAVLSKDYMTVPVGDVHTIESVLTMTGGKVVFAQGTYAKLERTN